MDDHKCLISIHFLAKVYQNSTKTKFMIKAPKCSLRHCLFQLLLLQINVLTN